MAKAILVYGQNKIVYSVIYCFTIPEITAVLKTAPVIYFLLILSCNLFICWRKKELEFSPSLCCSDVLPLATDSVSFHHGRLAAQIGT